MKKHYCLVLAGVLFASFFPFAQSACAQGGRLIAESDLEPIRVKQTHFQNLAQGVINPSGETEKKDISLLAQYFVYYMTLPEHQQDDKAAKRRTQFAFWVDNYILSSKAKTKNQVFRKLFSQELIKCFKTVFAKSRFGDYENDMVSCINAALLLPTFAKLDNIEIVDFLTDLVRDDGAPPLAWSTTAPSLGASALGLGPWLSMATLAPSKNYGRQDAIRLFAFQGLQEFFRSPPKELDFGLGATGFLDKDNTRDQEKRKKLANRLNPVIQYVLNPPLLRDQAEIEGYRYIRCEAIKALAQVPLPYVPEQPFRDPNTQTIVKGKILAPCAYALMRVLAEGEDALYPPATLAEKYEAMLGLCRVNGNAKLEEENLNETSRYNQEVGVALVGQFLVKFIQHYQKDREAFLGPDKLPPQLPWKVTSNIVPKALKDFSKNLAEGSKAKQSLDDISSAVEDTFYKMKFLQKVESPNLLIGVLREMPAPNPVVYEKMPYQIKLRWPPY